MRKLFFILLLSTVLASCKDSNKPAYNKRVITVTIEPLRYFAQRIVGDKFVVETMVPKGGNPETYEPSAKQMVNLSRSDIYIKVGSIGFERTWMKRLEKSAPHSIVIDSSEGIEMLESENGIPDPHTWMSCTNATIIARNIYNAVASIDAKDSTQFKSNLEKLLVDIEEVDTEIRSLLTKDKSRAFLIYHPILTYYAHDYDLQQLPLEEEGREPSAQQMEMLIKTAKENNVRTLFVQKEFAARSTDVILRSVGAKKEEINPLSYDWTNEMINVVKKLK